jgi:hypothetical protein
LILERLKYFFFTVHNDWQIGIVKSNLNTFVFSNSFPKVNWIKSDFNVYQADPFGIEKNGNLYLFYEEFIKEKDYAVLKCSVFDSILKKIDERVILDDGSHKSFPFVFENEGKFYLMPESGALDKLMVYECVEFPFNWRKERVILNLPCSDAILKKLGNEWLLFYTKSNQKDENETLYLRASSQLFGNWENETERIVNKELFSSRNAGDIHEIDGIFYRFTQNCKNFYGESIVVKQITNFEPQSYSEKFFCEKILPEKCNGFHTLNSTQNFILVDRRKLRYQLKPVSLIFKQIITKIRGEK